MLYTDYAGFLLPRVAGRKVSVQRVGTGPLRRLSLDQNGAAPPIFPTPSRRIVAFDPFHRSLHGRTLRSLRTLRQALPVMEYFAINLPWLAAGVLVWLGALAAYRLYLSPLAEFPGPKLAALTGWYETYYDCMKDGSFWTQIEQFHKQYGRHPISPFRCIV